MLAPTGEAAARARWLPQVDVLGRARSLPSSSAAFFGGTRGGSFGRFHSGFAS
jgi:hypothetical protein